MNNMELCHLLANNAKSYRSKPVETWLPVFPGFYCTIFDDTDRADDPPEDLEDILNPDFQPVYDYKSYYQDYSEEIVNSCFNLLSDFVYDIEFQNLHSPKEYNFTNDSINCIIYPKNKKIREYVNANFEEFKQYCKENYTSYSGFISFHSNSAEQWKIDTKNFTSWNSFTLGAVLDFIAKNENSEPEMSLYYGIIDPPYLPCYADYSECEGMVELVKKYVHGEYGRGTEIVMPEDFQEFEEKIDISAVIKMTIQEIENNTLNLF